MVGMFFLKRLFCKQVWYVSFHKEDISQKNNESYLSWHTRAKKEYLSYARKCLSVKPIKEEVWLFARDSIFSYIKAAKHAANLQKKNQVNDILLELSSHRKFYESIVVYDGFDDEEQNLWRGIFDDDMKGLENFQGFKYVYFLKNLDEHLSRPSYSKPRHRPEKPIKGKYDSAQLFMFKNIKYKRDLYEWNKLVNMGFPSIPIRESSLNEWEFHKKKCDFIDLFVVWAESQKDRDMSQTDRLKGYIKPKVPVREEGELVDNFYNRIVKYRKDLFAYDAKTLKPIFPIKLPWEKDMDFERRMRLYNKNIVDYFKKGGTLIKPYQKLNEHPTVFKRRVEVYEKELCLYNKIQEESKSKSKDKICLTLLYREEQNIIDKK